MQRPGHGVMLGVIQNELRGGITYVKCCSGKMTGEEVLPCKVLQCFLWSTHVTAPVCEGTRASAWGAKYIQLTMITGLIRLKPVF